MALISLRQLLDHAAEHEYGVPAFNVNNLEQVRAIMEGAASVDSPVILQASAGARKYAGSNFLKHLILGAIEEFPQFSKGTSAIALAVAENAGFSLAGGGETIAAIEKFGVADRISYISTGGGAFLEYIQGIELPAVKILKERGLFKSA